MSDSIYTCKRCGKSGEYYSTAKTLCPVTNRVVCQECADKAKARIEPRAFTHFGGATYDPARDGKRLSKQQQAVLDVMRDGAWHTSSDVARAVNAEPESYSAITSRIRDIRKIYNSEDAVESKNLGGGKWIYRMTVGVEA